MAHPGPGIKFSVLGSGGNFNFSPFGIGMLPVQDGHLPDQTNAFAAELFFDLLTHRLALRTLRQHLDLDQFVCLERALKSLED